MGFNFKAGTDFWLSVVPTLDPSTRPSITSVLYLPRLGVGKSSINSGLSFPTMRARDDPCALLQNTSKPRLLLRIKQSASGPFTPQRPFSIVWLLLVGSNYQVTTD
jgi:hypothetical protein